jgi:hypothetical protein
VIDFGRSYIEKVPGRGSSEHTCPTFASNMSAPYFLYLRLALDTMLSSCVCVKHSGQLIRVVRLQTGSKTNMAAFSQIHVDQAYLFLLFVSFGQLSTYYVYFMD